MKVDTFMEGNSVFVDGEEFVIEDFDRRNQVCELFATGGFHVTDEATDESAIRRWDDKEAEFAPAEREDLLQHLTVLEDDEDVDVFLEFVNMFVYGSPKERRQLSRALKLMSYPRLAEMALVSISRMDYVSAKKLVNDLSMRTPNLFAEMQRAVGQ